MDNSSDLAPAAPASLFGDVSNYVTAADSHNIGSSAGKTSWLEPETYVNALGNAGKFIAVAALSGLDSFYRTGAAVGNWAGGNFDERTTQSFISGLDSDLGSYYRENQSSADLVGFIGTSLIPGLAGIKALNMGQKALMGAKAGMVGGNIGKAMGLLVPQTERYVAMAAQEINASMGAASLLNTNTVKAIGAGFWQNTLEAAAFETFVQASMAKNATLEHQTLGDVATNIAVGGVLGGAIFATAGSASIFGKLKGKVAEERVARMPFAETPTFAGKTSPADKIIGLGWDTEMSA